MGEYRLEKRGSSYYIFGIMGKPIKIPSQMYPVSVSVSYFNAKNTKPFPPDTVTEQIKSIYNAIAPGIGACYSNIEQLVNALAAANIQAVPYVGWVFLEPAKPVYHCFAVINGCHILDFAADFSCFDLERYTGLNPAEARAQFASDWTKRQELPNSEYTVFGQAPERNLYFASPCSPAKGAAAYAKLMQAFPKHPCAIKRDAQGLTATQRVIIERQGQLYG